MTESQWQDIERNWREWFGAEDLPLGGKSPYWQLSPDDVFALPFFIHDILCKTKTQTLNGWTMKRVDAFLRYHMQVYAKCKIKWKECKIVKRKWYVREYLRGRAKTCMFVVCAYR